MSGTGYVNQGPDPRAGGAVGAVLAWLQRSLSFHGEGPPAHVIVPLGGSELMLAWPPFVSLSIAKKGGRFASLRAGWRYDANWAPNGGYVADVIVKLKMDHRVHF